MLAGGTALGQAITVLVSPVLTRLYSPEDFGVLAVYSSILGILSVVASWRYELAIPLPEKDEDAINLLALSLGIVVLMSLLVSFGLWHLSDQIVRWAKVPALRPYVWLLPIGLLLVGSYQVFNYWAVRKQVFKVIARTKLNQSLGAVFVQIGFGLLKPSVLGLLMGQIIGQSAGLLTLFRNFQKQWVSLSKAIATSKISAVAQNYRNFSLLFSWAGVMNTLSMQVPILMISSLFGPALTGFYQLAYQVLWVPTQLISQSASQVLLAMGSESYHRGDVRILAETAFKRFVLIGLPSLSLVGLISREMVTYVFGKRWLETGMLIQWLIPWIFLVFITSPLSSFSVVFQKQKQEAFFQAVLLASRVAALWGGWLIGSSHMAIILFSVASTVCWLGYLVWIMSVVGVPIFKVAVTTILKEFGINVPFLLSTYLVKVLSHSAVFTLVVGLINGCLVAVIISLRLRNTGEGNGELPH